MPEAEPIDFIGKIGIEKLLQSTLAGKKGKRFLEVDALGHIRRVLKETPPISGNNLYLTLDAKLQAYAEQLLKGKTGVIVALSPKTGEVLTLASNPGFDPNLFVNGMDKKTWQKLKDNPQNPLQNRATTGVYPPGSILKIVTALAALENKVISAHTKINLSREISLWGPGFSVLEKGRPWCSLI
ncbi:MAG: Peptidoglycan D,D-transpeptidase MrdA [Candidatus Methanoperedenaceae archaeon GB37]|nr:MAG: Peptidoglycan D,D-transpeptidase MrdA [Candidatus Methanoperedenaceae archaeon GB37]